MLKHPWKMSRVLDQVSCIMGVPHAQKRKDSTKLLLGALIAFILLLPERWPDFGSGSSWYAPFLTPHSFLSEDAAAVSPRYLATKCWSWFAYALFS